MEKHYDESETFAKCTRWNVNKGMRFASGTIKSAGDTLERQTMGVNKYASTFRMASCNTKTCNHRRKKRGVKRYENTQLFLQVRN